MKFDTEIRWISRKQGACKWYERILTQLRMVYSGEPLNLQFNMILALLGRSHLSLTFTNVWLLGKFELKSAMRRTLRARLYLFASGLIFSIVFFFKH